METQDVQVQDLLDQLDFYLTDKVRAASYTPAMDEFFFGEEYYLSDGGHSRVIFLHTGELILTSNSLDKPKGRWNDPEAVELREALAQARLDFWDSYGG